MQVILIDSCGGASAEGESLAALLLQRSCIKKREKFEKIPNFVFLEFCFRSLRNLKFLAYVVNQACSAAYQLAASCQEIYCRK